VDAAVNEQRLEYYGPALIVARAERHRPAAECCILGAIRFDHGGCRGRAAIVVELILRIHQQRAACNLAMGSARAFQVGICRQSIRNKVMAIVNGTEGGASYKSHSGCAAKARRDHELVRARFVKNTIGVVGHRVVCWLSTFIFFQHIIHGRA